MFAISVFYCTCLHLQKVSRCAGRKPLIAYSHKLYVAAFLYNNKNLLKNIVNSFQMKDMPIADLVKEVAKM